MELDESDVNAEANPGIAYTILSCTSQDQDEHPASAIKSPTTSTYWQTQGLEKKATLELALDSPVKIDRIVIGTEDLIPFICSYTCPRSDCHPAYGQAMPALRLWKYLWA